jgi:hypothetical protein
LALVPVVMVMSDVMSSPSMYFWFPSFLSLARARGGCLKFEQEETSASSCGDRALPAMAPGALKATWPLRATDNL